MVPLTSSSWGGAGQASSLARRYGVALATVLLMFAVRYGLGPYFGDRSALDLFLVAVVFSAWYGGAGPAALALGSSLLIGLWFFVPPHDSLLVTDFMDAVETASFLFAGVTISVVTSVMKRANGRVQKSSEEAIRKQADLAAEVERRRHAEGELQDLNARLEERVNERTAELRRATQAVQASVEQALQKQAELAEEVRSRRQVERELQELNARLEERVDERTVELREALKELEAYAYSIAHNLRAPLRAVVGMADLLEGEYRPTPDGEDYLGRLREAMVQMDALILGLLEYSRVSREEFRRDPVPLAEVAEEAARVQSRELSARQAQVTIDGPLPAMIGDRRALVEVVAQLLSNACKFVPPEREPVIRVRAEDRGSRVRLWVEDNGIGIDPTYHDRIFGVFERLHGPEDFAGTGIGLAIVRRCVERMGGRAGVESDPGKGSRFWIEGPGVSGAVS
jgi:signal transduction histidine kinase